MLEHVQESPSFFNTHCGTLTQEVCNHSLHVEQSTISVPSSSWWHSQKCRFFHFLAGFSCWMLLVGKVVISLESMQWKRCVLISLCWQFRAVGSSLQQILVANSMENNPHWIHSDVVHQYSTLLLMNKSSSSLVNTKICTNSSGCGYMTRLSPSTVAWNLQGSSAAWEDFV